MDITFFDENGYFVYCSALALDGGLWEATVFFEKKSDYDKTFVPGVRHRIKGVVFDSEDKAMSAARDYGLQKAQSGDVEMS